MKQELNLSEVIEIAAKTNKYNLTPVSIQKLKILDRTKIAKPLFWRNNAIPAWCIIETTAKNSSEYECCCYNDYWLGIYDNDRIKLTFSAYGGMCNYNFENFFDSTSIEHKIDLEIQEKFINKINYLIDEGILGF